MNTDAFAATLHHRRYIYIYIYALHIYTDLASTLQSVNPSSLALHNLLEEALNDPAFLKGDVTLAFKCQHIYPHKNRTFFERNPHLQLKGADARLAAAARNLGLAVSHIRDIEPLYKIDPSSGSSDAKNEGDFEDHANQEEAGTLDPADYLYGLKHGITRVEPRRKVIWCQDIASHAKDYARRYYDHSDGSCDSDKGELAPVYIADGKEL